MSFHESDCPNCFSQRLLEAPEGPVPCPACSRQAPPCDLADVARAMIAAREAAEAKARREARKTERVS